MNDPHEHFKILADEAEQAVVVCTVCPVTCGWHAPIHNVNLAAIAVLADRHIRAAHPELIGAA